MAGTLRGSLPLQLLGALRLAVQEINPSRPLFDYNNLRAENGSNEEYELSDGYAILVEGLDGDVRRKRQGYPMYVSKYLSHLVGLANWCCSFLCLGCQ